MSLKGDLKSINLANVLQDLASNELSGTLLIHTPDQKRHFWFEKGKLRLVGLDTGKGPTPLNGLLALGKIKATELNPKSASATLVRGFVRKGAISREDVRAGLEQQMIELVCDVFVWSGAAFEFAEGDPDENCFETSQLDHEIRLTVDPIIMEALRRVDEWAEIKKAIISPEEILVALRERAAEDGDATIERVASFFDGERRLRDIIDLTHLGQFQVFRAAAALLRAGAVRPLSVKEAIDRARACAAKKLLEPALRMARFGLDREPNNDELRQLAAEALEGLERIEQAASEYRQLLAAQVTEGRREQAAATCRKILALAPRDTYTHERLFELLVELKKKSDALQQGEALAAAYKRAGLPDKAKEVYTRLIGAFGDDDELLEAAGELARRLGDKKEAVGFYRRLFDRALARGDTEAVVQHARTIMRLDPTAEDIARRRMEVETGVYRQKQMLWKRLRLYGILALCAAILAYWITYEIRARVHIRDVRADADKLIEKQDWRTLLRRYNEFLASYPWSLAVAEARGDRDRYEGRYADEELPPWEKVEEERIPEALDALWEVRVSASLDTTREHVDALLSKLRQKAGETGNRFIQQAADGAKDPAGAEKIAQMTHPLALEALQWLCRHDSPGVRKAAAEALAHIGTLRGTLRDDPDKKRIRFPAALRTLVHVSMADGDVAVREAARAGLKTATGQDYGADMGSWLLWIERASQRQSPGGEDRPLPGGKPELFALLEHRAETFVEWRLANLGSKTAEFVFEREFDGLTATGTPLAPSGGRTRERRRVQLRPGEFIGGAVDLRDYLEGLAAPGTFRVGWTAKVDWGGTSPMSISSTRKMVEIKKK